MIQVAAALLGSSNYDRINEKNSFMPTSVILIDSDKSQIDGAQARIDLWESENPLNELEKFKSDSFSLYKPPEYLGYKGM